MLIFVGFSYGLVVPLFPIVLTIVVPIFCVLGNVASYRRARQHRAMLSPSELLSTSSLSCVLAAGHLSAVFDLLRTLSSVKVIFEFVSNLARGADPPRRLWLEIEEVRSRQSAKRRSEKPELKSRN